MQLDVEAENIRQIHQALLNLPREYPDRDMAHRAFGYLLLSKIRQKSLVSIVTLGKDWATVEYQKEVENEHVRSLF